MDVIEVAKGQDFAVEYRVRSGDGHGKPIVAVLTADAVLGATSIDIKPDHPAFASGDKFLFGQDVVLTLSSTCDAGDPTMPVTATTQALDAVFTVTLATQSAADRGKVTISALAASTVSKTAGVYYGALWRRDSGNTRPLSEFTFKLDEAGEDGFA
jgi:hypothetical protein